MQALLGDAFPVFPIGSVGGDDPGRRLAAEMRDVGLDLRFVQTMDDARTLFSFCFLYPDGTGGNMTTEDSASRGSARRSIAAAEAVIADLGHEGIALAVPEVPLAARRALLESAGRHGLFRAASFTRAEMPEARRSGLLGKVDLLAVNLEEAAAAAGLAESAAARAPADTAAAACSALSARAPVSPRLRHCGEQRGAGLGTAARWRTIRPSPCGQSAPRGRAMRTWRGSCAGSPRVSPSPRRSSWQQSWPRPPSLPPTRSMQV